MSKLYEFINLEYKTNILKTINMSYIHNIDFYNTKEDIDIYKEIYDTKYSKIYTNESETIELDYVKKIFKSITSIPSDTDDYKIRVLIRIIVIISRHLKNDYNKDYQYHKKDYIVKDCN